MADWFSQNAPTQNAPPQTTTPPSSGEQDWFAQNAPAMKQPEGSALSRFTGNLISNSPLGMLTGKNARIMVDLAHHAFNSNVPLSPETQEMLGGMVQSHVDQAQKAKAAWDRGDKVEAFGHSLATFVPLLGPAAAAAGEQIGGEPGKTDRYGNVIQQGQAPDIAGGVGAGLGVISNVVAPDAARAGAKVAAKVPGAAARALVPKIESTLNPVEQGAVDFARREGVPLTPGTITGNKFVKALQATTQNSPLGAQTAAEFNRGTVAGFQGLAGKLAEQAHPEPVTPESVGKAIPAKLQSTIRDLSQQRDEAYQRAWQGRDDPNHTYDVPVKMVQGDEVAPNSGIYDQKPVMKSVNMPVDVRDIKEQAQPIFDEMQWMPAADQASNSAYAAVKNLLKGDDFIPAWQAERGLSGLKDAARITSQSGVRDVKQGVAASLVPGLQESIDAAVARTGDDALAGLREGRATHARVMGVADLADQLRDEPVQNFGKLTWQGDTGLNFLRKIQEHAPEQMEPLGRALFQQMIDKSTEGGGFSKTGTLVNKWNAMGDGTKEIVYPNPQLRENIGHLVKAIDMAAQNPNPSGTALVQSATSVNPVRWAAGYLGSKLFFTPEGIALLTDAVKPQSPGSQALNMAKVRAYAGKQTPPPEEPPPTGGTPGGPTPPPPSGGPTGGPAGIAQAAPPEGIVTRLNAKIARNQSGGGRAALQQAVERNAQTVAANKAKLTPQSVEEAEPPLTSPGLLRNLLDNPANEFQYTTPQGVPVYKAPAESTPPSGPPSAAARSQLALPKVGDTIEVSPPSLNEMYGRPAPWVQGPVTEIRKDPITGDSVPIIQGPHGREMAGTAGYWRPVESTPPGGSPGEPAPGSGAAALQSATQRNAATVASNKAKLRGTSYITRPAGSPVKPALPTTPDVTIPTDAAIQQGATGARPEVSGPLQPASENQRAETQVSVPGSSRQYKARYQVIELKDLQSSHNGQTFQPNPNYKYVNDRDYARSENQGKVVAGSSPGQFDPRYMLTDNPDASNGPPVTSEGHAMGGNGRSMILQRVYATNPQGAKAYRNLLTLKAPQFGLDPQQIRGMKQPVLVREIDPSEFEQGGQQNAVTDFNKVGTASLRGSEKAVADSRRVSQGTLDHIAGRLESGGEDATLSEVLDGRGGADVLNRLIQDGVISPQESAAYVDRGELTADGKTRVSKLMLGRFFRDPQQLDATPPSIRNKLERIAAPLAKVESRPEWSLAQPMQQALDLIEEARAHGQKNLDDMVSQSGLFGSQTYSPEAVALAKMLQNAKPNDITRAVRQYAQESSEAEQGAGLFGEPPTAAESFEAAFGRHR